MDHSILVNSQNKWVGRDCKIVHHGSVKFLLAHINIYIYIFLYINIYFLVGVITAWENVIYRPVVYNLNILHVETHGNLMQISNK